MGTKWGHMHTLRGIPAGHIPESDDIGHSYNYRGQADRQTHPQTDTLDKKCGGGSANLFILPPQDPK